MPGFIGDEASQVEQIAPSAKRACRLATVAHIADLSAVAADSAAFDGLTVEVTWRVLVLSQTDPVENGVYVVASVAAGVAALLRASDFDVGAECPSGTTVPVGSGGNTLFERVYMLTTAEPVEIGTSELTFANAAIPKGSVAAIVLLADQAAYDALDPVVATTLYFIPEA